MAVKVAMRVRPMLPLEDEDYDNSVSCIDYDDNQKSVIVASEKQFTLDKCFRDDVLQNEVYTEFISPLVNQFLNGNNCSVLAYGQTGSGKSYTMGTDYIGMSTTISDDTGIIPRILTNIFEEAKREPDPISFKVSFLEVLNDTVFDILAQPKQVVQVQDRGKEVLFSNLSEVLVENLQESLFHLTKGIKSRTQARTELNINSSRSHAIFIVKMHRETENSMFESTLHLVDLAGSENSKRAKTRGDRFVEGVSINKSLLFLGEVITALSSRSGYIPYRNHVLTRILKETLNGTSFMRMIACVNPNVNSIPETINTLRYACSAKNIPHRTLPKVAKENRFQEQLKQVLPTPVKGNIYRPEVTPCNNSRSSDFIMPSTGKGLGLPLLSSTISRPPPPKFNISPENPKSLPVEDFLSPLANKISSLLDRRISETVERTVQHSVQSRISEIASTRPFNFLEEDDTYYASFLPRPSVISDPDVLSKLVSPVAAKVQKLMEQTVSLRFRELEQKLKECETVLKDSCQSSCRRTIIPDVSETTLCHSSIEEDNSNQSDPKFASPIISEKGFCTSPLKATRRRTVIDACFRTSPVKTRRRTIMESGVHTSPIKTRRRTIMEAGVRNSLIKTRRRTIMEAENIQPIQDYSEIKQKWTSGVTKPTSQTRRETEISKPPLQDFNVSPVKTRRRTLMEIGNIGTTPAAPMVIQNPSVVLKPKSKTRRQTRNFQPGAENAAPLQYSSKIEKHRDCILKILNAGSIKELQKLPAIGPKSAYMIHTYRTLYGTFQSVDELKHVGLPQNIWNRFFKANLLTL